MYDDDEDEYESMYPGYVDETKRAWLAEGAVYVGPDAATVKKLKDWLAKPDDPNDSSSQL